MLMTFYGGPRYGVRVYTKRPKSKKDRAHMTNCLLDFLDDTVLTFEQRLRPTLYQTIDNDYEFSNGNESFADSLLESLTLRFCMNDIRYPI